MVFSQSAENGGAPYHERVLMDPNVSSPMSPSDLKNRQNRNTTGSTSSVSPSGKAKRKSVQFSDEVHVHQRTSAPSMGNKHVSKFQRTGSIFDDPGAFLTTNEDASENSTSENNGSSSSSSSSSQKNPNNIDTTLSSVRERKRSALALEYQRMAATELMKEAPDWPKLRRLIQLCEFQLMHTDPESGNTTLHRASYTGAYDIIMYCLKQNGADVNMRNNLGRTPLMLAAEQNNDNVVKILLESGADPHLTTVGGMTALHFACKANAEKACKVLLELVEDSGFIEMEDNSRKTPIQVTSSQTIKDLLVRRISSQHSIDDFNNY